MRTKGEIVSRERCAAIFGIARTTLDDWVGRGCPVHEPSPKRGVPAKFDTAAVFGWRLATVVARADPANLDAGRERARLFKEQADAQELRNQKARGEVVDIHAVGEAVTDSFLIVRSHVLAMPTKLAPRLEGKDLAQRFAIITQHCHETLTELSETEVVVKVSGQPHLVTEGKPE